MTAARSPAPHILATDISTRVLDAGAPRASSRGTFDGFPSAMAARVTARGVGRFKGKYKVKPEVAGLIEFERLNLIEPFPHAGLFHVIFCRNVMIYFDRTQAAGIVRN